MPEEYWGCRRTCWDQGRHTLVAGECERARRVCKHPAETICWESDGSEIVCGECREGLSVRTLAENAQVALYTGCTCRDDDCMVRCGAGKPLGWTLDPAQVLAILSLLEDR